MVFFAPLALSAEIMAGFAHLDITPPTGGQTTGYCNALVTDGIHDPTSAHMVVLEIDQYSVAMAICDLCIFNSPWLREEVRGLSDDHFLLANTHTHAGPSMQQNNFPSAEKPWRLTVEERILATLRKTLNKLFPAHFAASRGELQLGYKSFGSAA